MIKKIFTNKFVRNVALLASGTAGAQAITMAISPFITRMYGPENYGVMGVFVAVLTIITPLTALSYPIAIVLPKKDSEAKGIALLSLKIAMFISIFTAIIFVFFSEQIISIFKIHEIAAYILLIPFAMVFDSMQQIIQQWLIRKKMFKISARIAISQSLIINTIKTGFGFIWPSAFVLIVTTTINSALMAIQLFFGMKKWGKLEEQLSKEDADKDFKGLALKYNDFAFYRTPQILINSISQSLPVLMLAAVFGPATAGFFSLGKMVLSAPATLIGNSVGNVFYPKIAETVNLGKDPLPLINKATLLTFLTGLIPFFIIMVFGETIFKLIFGSEWNIAGQYAQWMALWLLTSLSARPIIAVIPVIKVQGFFLLFEIVTLLVKILGLYIGAFYYNAYVAVSIYSIITAISYLLLYVTIAIYISMKKH